VTEVDAGLDLPFLIQPEWAAVMPWLIQGITWRGPGEPFDLGLFGEQPVGRAMNRWRLLREAVGFSGEVHSRQVHRARVSVYNRATEGLLLLEGFDGHATRTADLLLTVSVADCIPVYVVDAAQRAVALLHAGWRGLAAGMIEAGLAVMSRSFGSTPPGLRVHMGPAICGACYEVGPEVHELLGLARPALPEPVDLVAVACARAVAAGVPRGAVTVSAACPRCEADRFFSHRAGSAGRQMAVLGIRGA
jgi:YfiH family protein